MREVRALCCWMYQAAAPGSFKRVARAEPTWSALRQVMRVKLDRTIVRKCKRPNKKISTHKCRSLISSHKSNEPWKQLCELNSKSFLMTEFPELVSWLYKNWETKALSASVPRSSK